MPSNRRPLIYLITKGEAANENFREKSAQILQVVEQAVEAEISFIQIREKRLSARLLFDLARESARITAGSATKLLVNDRADIALAAGADGVHLTGASLSAKIIRRHFPENFIVGVSAHTFEEVERAKAEKADFAVFGPVFATPGKGEPVGLNVLRLICERVEPFPVLALGGIDATNFRQASSIASGFAAIRFLNDAENLRRLKNESLFDDCGT